jgi:predicted enzyme related to lactoylglutathione lyase
MGAAIAWPGNILRTAIMGFISSHFGLNVRDLPAAKRFYCEQLGLPILQETPAINLLAVRAGEVRLSIFGGRTDSDGPGPSQIILATGDLNAAIADLESRGVKIDGAPKEAPGFMRFVYVSDPDGNAIGIVEYLRDPLAPI